MPITKAVLQERIRSLQLQRAEAIKTKVAVEGALQNCLYLLEWLEEEEQCKRRQPGTERDVERVKL